MTTARADSYWMQVSPIIGSSESPRDGGIVIVGSGISGVSAAYWLQKAGFSDLTLVDYDPLAAATFRNCGHILHGTVESMHAMCALHGEEKARAIWEFSVGLCQDLADTVETLGIACDYRREGYLVIAIDEAEEAEIQSSVALLNKMGFPNRYVPAAELATMGFLKATGGRFESGSASAHPVKFRNGLLRHVLAQGARYHSGVHVQALSEDVNGATLATESGPLRAEAVVIATNAYSPLLSDFFQSHHLVEPFRGQILTSRRLKHSFAFTGPHSFDHGYEYALVTPDNRLMLGGWRNRTPGGEIGTYDLTPNPLVENGLKAFAAEHYALEEPIEWEFSWSGIMAASATGFPFIGPAGGTRIFTVAGYTGHGFSWAHGSAKLLANIMAGQPLPAAARYFDPLRRA